MSAFDTGLSDVSFTGLDDTAEGFSGESTFQDVTSTGSPLQLDTSNGIDLTSSTYDLWGGGTSSAPTSLSFSGVSDPPFGSATLSTPAPGGIDLSGATSNAFSALSKFGFGVASLLGNHPSNVQAVAPTNAAALTGRNPIGATNGTSLTLLLIIAAAIFLIVAKGGE